MSKIVTTADLCEEAHAILSMRFDGDYLCEGEVYCQKAQWMFEDILSDLERGLVDKGYTFRDGEWSPTSFFIGDPSQLLKAEHLRKMLEEIKPHGKAMGKYYLDDMQEVPILWSYTVAGDGVFQAYRTAEDGADEHIGEVTVDSGLIAFVPEDIADKDTVEKALREEHVLPHRVLSIDNFSFSEENGSVTVGDVWVNVKW